MRRLMAYLPLVLCVLFVFASSGVFAEPPIPDSSLQPGPAVNSPSPSSPPATGLKNTPPASGTGGEAMTDIIDIKPPEKIGFDKRIFVYLLYALGILILIGLLFFLIDYFLKKKKKTKIQPVIVLPPDTIAFQNLDELEKAQGLEEREFYFRLTAIIRAYLEGRYGIDALEMTTEELLPRLSEVPMDKTLSSELKELLKSTDPVKFAGIRTGHDKMNHDLSFAREFVEKTKVVPEIMNNGKGVA